MFKTFGKPWQLDAIKKLSKPLRYNLRRITIKKLSKPIRYNLRRIREQIYFRLVLLLFQNWKKNRSFIIIYNSWCDITVHKKNPIYILPQIFWDNEQIQKQKVFDTISKLYIRWNLGYLRYMLVCRWIYTNWFDNNFWVIFKLTMIMFCRRWKSDKDKRSSRCNLYCGDTEVLAIFMQAGFAIFYSRYENNLSLQYFRRFC